MRSFSEIETAVKRATRGIGFSWGVAEEVGKNIRLLEMFGLPGFKNINQYFKVLRNQDFEKISTISTINNSKSLYCPITMGLNFFDQSIHLKDANNIEINNLGFPLLFIPFVFACSDDENTPNMCIDESLISSDVACPAVVDPVCGCDGNTYNNSCEAFNWYGVIAYEDGPCN